MPKQLRKLVGSRDLITLLICVVISAVFVAVLLRHLRQRHEVYQLGYEVAAQTHEHNRLLEINRRLAVEAALQSGAERLEGEAIGGLGLRHTDPGQIIQGRQ